MWKINMAGPLILMRNENPAERQGFFYEKKLFWQKRTLFLDCQLMHNPFLQMEYYFKKD